MKKRYNVNMFVREDKKSAYSATKTFVNVEFKEVMDFIMNFVDTNNALYIKFEVRPQKYKN